MTDMYRQQLEARITVLELAVQQLTNEIERLKGQRARSSSAPALKHAKIAPNDNLAGDIERVLRERFDLDAPAGFGFAPNEIIDTLRQAGLELPGTNHSQKILLARVLKSLGVYAYRDAETRLYQMRRKV